jgi:hypothetical protein
MELILRILDAVLDFLTLGQWSKRQGEDRIGWFEAKDGDQ